MKRIVYLLSHWISSMRHWLIIRISKAGALIIFCLGASALLGLDTNKTMAYQVFTFLGSLIFFSLITILFSKNRYSIKRKLPPMATVGEPLHYRIIVENETGQTKRDVNLIEEFKDPRPSYRTFCIATQINKSKNIISKAMEYARTWKNLILLNKNASANKTILEIVHSRKKVEVKMKLNPLRRGYVHFSSVKFTNADPLGLFMSTSTSLAADTLLVLPKRYRLSMIKLGGRRKYNRGGVAFASNIGDSDEFVALRDYRPGDPLKSIHWKSWAKTGKPVVKEYEDEFISRHALILDTFTQSYNPEIFEEAVSVAASFASTIETGESLLDLMFVGEESYCFTRGRSLGTTGMMLEALACVEPCLEKPFELLGEFALGKASMISSAICIFLDWDEERREFTSKLRSYGIELLVLVVMEKKARKKTVDPDHLKESSGNFHLLETGNIEEALARL